jgi:hypothetical protein
MIKRKNLKELNAIVSECVSDSLSNLGILTEMAITLKNFKRTIIGERQNLAENWCLCKYCQLYDPGSLLFNHWKNELDTCCSQMKYVELKGGMNPYRTLYNTLIRDYEINTLPMVEKLTKNKFKKEHIFDKDKIQTVYNIFVDKAQSIVNFLADSDTDFDEYFASEFTNVN